MKYDANRHYLYPVIRPHSDDYPKSSFSTLLENRQTSSNVEVKLEFLISDEIIEDHVLTSQARCLAMLYCRDTMYRQPLETTLDNNRFCLLETISMRYLRNQVEVHPAIVACDTIENFPTSTAHTEYGNISIPIEKGRPLAVDNSWSFVVNPQQLKVDSLFKLKVDNQDEYKVDEFDLKIDHNERFVDIIANQDTIDMFRRLRGVRNATIPSVFLSSLITVLSYFRELDDDNDGEIPESIPSIGWYRCIHQKLKDNNINLGSSNFGSEHTIMRAAQLLLTSDSLLRPFGRLFKLGLIDDAE